MTEIASRTRQALNKAGGNLMTAKKAALALRHKINQRKDISLGVAQQQLLQYQLSTATGIEPVMDNYNLQRKLTLWPHY